MEVVWLLVTGIVLFFGWYFFASESSKNHISVENSLRSLYEGYTFEQIRDQFESVEEVSKAIQKAGLESSNLIFGIDYTKSNLTQGRISYSGRSLHDISGPDLNPYQQVISVLGQTLEPFDDDGVIPAFGFGDVSTRDQAVFSLSREGLCSGFKRVLQAYAEVTPGVILSGPTSFAPLINQAVEIVHSTKAYHILVIVADGQVTAPRLTSDAIVRASNVALSIIVVGVGDGPWDLMREFDDRLPQRKFDNFQFVEYNKILKESENPDAAFALAALMEIPDQFKAIRKLGLLG